MNAPYAFSHLTRSVRELLLACASGKHHLAIVGRAALDDVGRHPEKAAGLQALAKELYTAAWLSDPLDGVTAANLAALDRRLPFLPKAAAKLVGAVSAMWDVRAVSGRIRRLEKSGDYPALAEAISRELSAAPGRLSLVWTLLRQALANNDFPTAEGALRDLAPIKILKPVSAKLRADALFLKGEYSGAAQCWTEADAVFPGFFSDRIGEALYRSGETDAGISAYAQAVAAAPWRVNAALRLFEIRTGRDRERAALPGSLAVLLYSYNNAQKLDETLASLRASDLGEKPVLVRVLVNGCTDDAETVVDRWAERFGEVFEKIVLPVNVGAAPARNWLMRLPEVAACDFAAYLDDDVRLPEDWLSRLGAAVAAHPEAGVWGCRVVDFERTANMQQVDLGLLPPREGEPLFSLSDSQLHEFDFGQYSYMRPAVSVTGCCHLFRTGVLLEAGGFDIRFSPTQYDDLDHDLRLNLSGAGIVYQGHLAVEHKKVSGSALSKSRAASANATANMYKLKNKYSKEEIRTIRDRAFETLEADFLAKSPEGEEQPRPEGAEIHRVKTGPRTHGPEEVP